MALVGSHSQGGRSVNLRHGGESFRERGQGQWTDRDGSREYGNNEGWRSLRFRRCCRCKRDERRLQRYGCRRFRQSHMVPSSLMGWRFRSPRRTWQLGGIRENWRTREGRLAIMKVAVLLISIMKSLIQKISSLAILNQQTSRLMGLLRYR